MKTKLTLLHNRVLLKQDEAPEKTAGGIIIPDAGRERPLTGEVIAAGKDAAGLKKGDKVMYGKNAGFPLLIEGIEYLMLKDHDVLVVL